MQTLFSARTTLRWVFENFELLDGTLYNGEGMATHSSVLAWRISWTEEPGGLQSIGWERDRTAGI